MTTPYIYYRVETGPVFDFLKDLQARRVAIAERLNDWAKQRGATGFVPGFGKSVMGGWAINSLIFDNDPDTAVWRRRRNLTTDGHEQWAPRQNTKAGKALAKEMQAMEGLPSDDEFCSAFGFPHGIRYKGNGAITGSARLAYLSLTTARMGWTSDACYWVVLPNYALIRAEYEADGYEVETPAWTAPEGMIPLTKAHYDLAVAEAEVARIEKANAA